MAHIFAVLPGLHMTRDEEIGGYPATPLTGAFDYDLLSPSPGTRAEQLPGRVTSRHGRVRSGSRCASTPSPPGEPPQVSSASRDSSPSLSLAGEKLGLNSGDRLKADLVNGTIVLRPAVKASSPGPPRRSAAANPSTLDRPLWL